ncbi:trypsin-like peptidase domain-containing protein [Aneurinibacillus migulanus]|uniref:S1C family serine protease n=1 Tax=Aneurinibacillus migulanus TaxID=47500 RepID=UPI002E2237AE|nr:trypsin-like peptidase domain-containing protein [Aneurinibacillus migulanus]
MGFYDEEYAGIQKKRKSGRASVFLSALIGAIIGGMLVLMLLPSLVRSGYVPEAKQAQPKNVTSVPVSTSGGQTTSNVTKAVNKTENTVVGVINMQQHQSFAGMSTQMEEQGNGSGVIFRKTNGKAYIVTNNHVIEGASEVQVSLATNKKPLTAKIIGADPITDLAVLEIDGGQVKEVAEFGDSSKLQVGESAIAIGNPLGMEFSRTVTGGIISSTDRTMPVDLDKDGQTDYEMNVIQTDAAINPGNSGGPLLNAEGQVIGINSLKIAQTGVEGLGFAIPINEVSRIIDDLIRYHSVQRPYIGIGPVDLQRISPDEWKNTLGLPEKVQSGVVVRNVENVSPAQKAGLQMYDVIVKLDNQEIENSAQLRKYLFEKRAGDNIEISYYRDGKLKIAKITLGKQEAQ